MVGTALHGALWYKESATRILECPDRGEVMVERAGGQLAELAADGGDRAGPVGHEALGVAQLLHGHDARATALAVALAKEVALQKRFSVRIGTPLQGSPLGYQVWVVAIYLLTTSLKGQSSMKLHRDLRVTQKTAWFLAHRIRQAFDRNGGDDGPYRGPVEVDETFMGGKVRNMSNAKRRELAEAGRGRGTDGKTMMVGAKGQEDESGFRSGGRGHQARHPP